MDAENGSLVGRALQFAVALAGISLLVWLCLVLQAGNPSSRGMRDAANSVTVGNR